MKKAEMLQAKVIGVKGESALVEFVQGGNLKRVYLPKSEADKCEIWGGDEKNKVLPPVTLIPVELADMAIAVINPFEGFAPKVITAEEFTEALHAYGIWTVDDAVRNQQVIYGVLNLLYQAEYVKLIQKITEVK
jgi:hypothetical protein